MKAFQLPIGMHVDFGLDEAGYAIFRDYQEQRTFRLNPDEFAALFQHLILNQEEIAQGLKALENEKAQGKEREENHVTCR